MPGALPWASAGTSAPERSSPLCFYCPGSVSLCNPPGFVFGVGWVPPSRSPRAMQARRCGAAAQCALWTHSFAAGTPRWHFDVSGARRVPRCLSWSLALSPPLLCCAHTRTRTHARTHGGGGLSAITSRTEKLCSPLSAPDSSGRHSPALVLSPTGPAPLQLIGHSPAPRPRRLSLQQPLAGATFVTVASEAVGGRWASPTAAEALRRGRPPPTPFYLFIFPFGQTLAGVGAITARGSRGIDGGGVRFGNK